MENDSIAETAPKIYNPRKGTVASTVLNTLTTSIGGGILSLPLAMYKGSIIISSFLVFLCAFLSNLANYIIAVTDEVTDKYNYSDAFAYVMYPDVPLLDGVNARKNGIETVNTSVVSAPEGTHELAVYKRRQAIFIITEFIISTNNFGSLIIYSRVIGDAVPAVLASFFNAKGVAVSKWLWYVVPSVIFNILLCARTITELKFVSLMGFLTILYLIVLIMVRFFINLKTPYTTEEGYNEYRVTDVRFSLFSTISSFIFAYSVQFNVPFLYQELKDRRLAVYLKSLCISTPIITFSYYFTSLFGYLIFGSLVSSEDAGGDIMNNFRENDISANVARILLFFHFLAVYPIVGFAARRGTHKLICKAFVKKKTYDEKGVLIPVGDPSITSRLAIIIETTIMVWVATLLAYYVPGISSVIDFLGLIFILPMLIFPGFMGIRVFQTGLVDLKESTLKILRVLSWIMIVLGVVFLVCCFISFGFDYV